MTSMTRSVRWTTLACLLVALLGDLRDPAPASALPSGGQVGEGAAAIHQPNAQSLRIDQMSDRALLNWQGFSIGQGETVQFVQPSATSLAVNRVLGGDPSLIFGQLLANGRVFLLNPNGVLFGPHATVNVGGLMATTLSLKSYDLTTGRFELAQDPTKAFASVINQGTLRVADHGFLVLAAPGVVNDGLIVAKFGQVGLAAGTQLAVDFRGDGLIQYAVDGKVLDQVTDPAGKPLASAVSNTGRIDADGGTVLLTGKASSAVVSSVINQSGVIQARRLESQGGEIVLRGGDEGAVIVAGTLDTTGEQQALGTGQWALDGKGGSIDIRGEKVGLTETARLDVSGQTGGGMLRVGGAFQGKDGGPNAQQTVVGPGAMLLADAGTTGDGGTVIVWADGVTKFGGTISARGGSAGGNGGFAEVSGRTQLVFSGTSDLTAPVGRIGTLLLDPEFGVVGNNGAGAIAGNILFADPPNPGTTTIGADNLSTLLGSQAVILQANTDWTFANNLNAVTGNHALTVQAGRSIIFNTFSAVNLTNAAFTAEINASGADGNFRGSGPAQFVMHGGTSLTTAGGPVTVSYGLCCASGPSPVQTGEILIGQTGGATISTGAGSISLTGLGASPGIVVRGNSQILTTSGAITLTGTGTAPGHGVTIEDSGTLVRATTTGTISITGTGGNGPLGPSHGVNVEGATVQTNSGALTILGNAGNTDDLGSAGVVVNGGTVTTATGPLTITGTGGDGSDAPNGSSFNLGIWLSNGGLVSSTGAAGAGPVALTGFGGGNTNLGAENYGVFIDGTGPPHALVTTKSGNLTVTGTGGGGGCIGCDNYGIRLENGAGITSTGLATITVIGHGQGIDPGIQTFGPGQNLIGGPTANGNILIQADTTTPGLDSIVLDAAIVQGLKQLRMEPFGAAGNVGLAGAGGDFQLSTAELGNLANGFTGLFFGRTDGTGLVGFGSDGFTFQDNVTLRSQGADGFVQIFGPLATASSGNSISLLGGAGVAVINDGSFNFGNVTTVHGPITMTGLGTGSFSVSGVEIHGGTISSGNGNITINGTGSGLSSNGVSLRTNGSVPAVVKSSGGSINITGTGASPGDPDLPGGPGIFIDGAGTEVTSGTGNITMTGTGGDGLFGNRGIWISGGARVAKTGAGTLMLTGHGGPGGPTPGNQANDGVVIEGAGTIVETNTATLSIIGTGGGLSAGNSGVIIQGGAHVRKSGAGTFTIMGTGGSVLADNPGVIISDSGTLVSAITATMNITGIGGDGFNSDGLVVRDSALVAKTGAGTLTLLGTGGGTDGSSDGIVLTNSGKVLVHTATLSLVGAGGSTGDSNNGILLDLGGEVNKTLAGTLTVTGTGGGGAGVNNSGVHVVGGALITAGTADLVITGTGGATGMFNHGVFLENGGRVTKTGAGALNVTGAGGASTDVSHGVFVSGLDSLITGTIGPITITGNGGGGGGSGNDGIFLEFEAKVTSTGLGAAPIQLIGTGGLTTGGGRGIALDVGALVSSNSGALSLVGTATGTANQIGIQLRDGSSVIATGTASVTLTGTGTGTAPGIMTHNAVPGPNNQIGAQTGTVSLFATTDSSDSIRLIDVTIFGTGNLILAPLFENESIGLGGVGGQYSLDQTEIDAIQNGFNHIFIGRSDGTAPLISGGPVTFLDPVTIQNGPTGSISINGPITGNDNASITLTGAPVELAGDLVTNNNAINLESAVTVAGPPGTRTIDAKMGTITVSSSFDAASFDVILSGDGIDLLGGAGSVFGTGQITLQPGGVGTSVGIAGGAGTLQLTTTDLDALADGFTLIVLGRTDGTGAVTVGVTGYTFQDGVGIVSGPDGGTGSVTIDGPVMTTSGLIGVAAGRNVVINPTGSLVSGGGGNIFVVANAEEVSTGNFIGLDVNGGLIDSGSGQLLIGGRGGTTGANNIGALIHNGAVVKTTGGGDGLSILGFGGNGGTSGHTGVLIQDPGTTITSDTQPIVIEGTGGNGSGTGNRGVSILGGAQVVSTGTATITIEGTGGSSTDNNHGVALGQVGTAVTSVGGLITITGTGGGSASGLSNHGVLVSSGAVIDGTNGAGVTLIGTGGLGNATNTFNGEAGVYIIGLNGTHVRTVDGDLTIDGTGGGTSFGGYGVLIRFGAPVEATGMGNVIIDGTGSPTGSSFNHGVAIVETGTIVRAALGSVTIGMPPGLGTGAQGGGLANNNYGVLVSDGAHIEANGGVGSDIVISGVGGGGGVGTANYGVTLLGAGTRITTQGGAITINGEANGGASPGVFATSSFLLIPPNLDANGGIVTINSNP